MFLDKRVNQGATGRVHPNAFTDRLSNERVERPYRAVFVENEYLDLILLPEIGGPIFAGLDMTNGFNFFYRQQVTKLALIGLLAAWPTTTSPPAKRCSPGARAASVRLGSAT